MRKRTDYAFLRGVAFAAAVLITLHDEPTTAWDVLDAAGLETLTALKKARVDESDLNPLIVAFADEEGFLTPRQRAALVRQGVLAKDDDDA